MERPPAIRRAYSTAPDAAQAAREIHAGLVQDDPGLVVLFCSSGFDLDVLGREIHDLFGDAEVIGCTTAGEITPVGYLEGSITGFSLAAADCTSVTQFIPDISRLQIPRGTAAADALIAAARAPIRRTPSPCC
jgi:hypothetical protein